MCVSEHLNTMITFFFVPRCVLEATKDMSGLQLPESECILERGSTSLVVYSQIGCLQSMLSSSM